MNSRVNNRRPALLSLAVLILVAPPAAAQPCPAAAQPWDSCRAGCATLVLSGGGSAGMAHVGVLRALDSLGVCVDLIVSTSMGAIVGAMYASGYSADELDSLVRDLPLDGLFRGYKPQLPRPLEEWPPLVVLEQLEGGFSVDLSVTRENEANALLSYWLLRGNLEARGDFDALPIPFRAIATDLARMEPVVLYRGDLAQAVRASISIPLVFRPVEIDDRWLVDGGLSANIPIEVARELGAGQVIVSDVTEHLRADTLDLGSPGGVVKVIVSSLFDQKGDTLLPGDIFIRPEVDGFPKLDFSPENTAALIERGYAAAVEALAVEALSASPCLAQLTNGRSSTEAERSGNIGGNGVLENDRPSSGRSPEALEVIAADLILELGTQDQYEAVWLRPEPAGDSVRLRPQIVAAAPRLVGVGLAYDNELGVRTWFGVVDRRLIGDRAVVGGVVALGGRRQEVELNLRSLPRGLRALTPLLSVGLAHESIRRFDSSGSELSSLKVLDLHGFLGAEKDLGKEWIAGLGIHLRAWDEPTGDQMSAGLGAHVARAGESDAPAFRADGSWTTIHRRFALEAAWPLRVGKSWVTPELRYGWGQDLPPQLEFQLGGDDGFPGLHIGERRGDREALLRLSVSQPLAGPIRLGLDLASGTSGAGGPAVPRGDWLWGARVGLGLDTGFCPVTVAYGWTDGGRSALFLRIGKWF